MAFYNPDSNQHSDGSDSEATPNELTDAQIERQDFVDNEILALVNSLKPEDAAEIEWDGEILGKIRDAVQSVLVDDLDLMTEQEFYPFIED